MALCALSGSKLASEENGTNMMQFVGVLTEEVTQARFRVDELDAQRVLGGGTLDVVMTHFVSWQIAGMDSVQQCLLDAGTFGSS